MPNEQLMNRSELFTDSGRRKFILIGYSLIALLTLSLGAWSVFAQLQGAVISGGQLEVETGRQVVQHQYGGKVKEVLVKENDLVTKDQVLIELDPEEISKSLRSSELQYYEALAQTNRLRAESNQQKQVDFDAELLEEAKTNAQVEAIISSQESLLQARLESETNQRARLVERIAQLEQISSGMNKQIESLTAQEVVNREEMERQEELWRKKLTTNLQVTSARNAHSQVESNLISARSTLTDYQSQKDQAQSELDTFEGQRYEEIYAKLRESEANLNRIREERGLLRDQMRGLHITSPSDGYVYDLAVISQGAVISPAQPIMYVIPTDAELIVKSQVKPQDVNDIYIGQEAEISFSGLRRRMLPKLEGEVTKITADSVTDERSGFKYFVVDIAIPPAEIGKLEGEELRPGMPAEVFIKTTKQSPLAYFMSPARSYFDRALR